MCVNIFIEVLLFVTTIEGVKGELRCVKANIKQIPKKICNFENKRKVHQYYINEKQ